MSAAKRVLIVFPDEWLRYSPSVLNLYACFREKGYDTSLIYFDNDHFKNGKLVEKGKVIHIGKTAAYFWRKTLGYKFYKMLRLFFLLLAYKFFRKRFDLVIAIDSSGYAVTKPLFWKTIYFSLETEKDSYYKICTWLGIDTLLIQSKERAEFMAPDNQTDIYFIQNAPILEKEPILPARQREKRLLYMGNLEFGYGLEQFIDCINQLEGYTLTLKGIKNRNFYDFLQKKYQKEIESGKIIFDFNYIEQAKILDYVSGFYIGITGYDLELAKKSFNYFSSPAGKLFNYYAAGVPVIGINIIGLKSVTDLKAGVLLDEVSAQNIRKAITEIESDYLQYCQNCLEAAKTFDFKKAFNNFIDNYPEKPVLRSGGLISFITHFNLRSFFTQGHERSVKTKKNILSSILIKCFSIVISFLLIPLALDYLNPINYGIWLTLTSVIGWFAFFDIGLGNGLRNKLAEAFAKNDKVLARTYISTSYIVLTAIIGIVYVAFYLIFPYVNWSDLLNTPAAMNAEISRLVFIVFSLFSLQFIIKLITMILKADQRPAFSTGINTLASLLSLIFIFALTKTTQSSLLWLSVGISAANIVAPLVATLWFFSTDYRSYIPSFKFVKLAYAKDLMGLGFAFFIMQFAALVIFSTDSYIIAKLYGPEEVTPYNIAFKYFSIVSMAFGIITTPFWTAYTDAYHKNDFEWIRRTTRKLGFFWVVMCVLVVAMLLFSNTFYELWVGDKVKIPFLLSLSMGIWILISTWTTIFGNFLSGVGKIRLSLYHSLFVIVINIPLSIFLARYLNMGSAGVMLATCLCVLPQVFLHPIQYKKIVSGKAKGIWNR